MGNCSGLNLDQANLSNGELNEIQAYDVNINEIENEDENEGENEDLSQLIEQINNAEQKVESLLTENNQLKSNIQSPQLSQRDKSEFCKKPKVKHYSKDKLPEKLLDCCDSYESDMKLQQIFNKNSSSYQKSTNQTNIQDEFLAFYDSGETNIIKQYKQIKVYSRLVEDEQKKQTSQQFQEYHNQFVQNNKFTFNQISENTNVDDEVFQTESDGNYEGSEDENMKGKEKLIDNLFSDRSHWIKQLTIIADADESLERSPDYKKKKHQQSPSKKDGSSKDSVKKSTLKIADFPTFIFQGGTFQGEVTNQKRNGIGQQTFLDGTVYVLQNIIFFLINYSMHFP